MGDDDTNASSSASAGAKGAPSKSSDSAATRQLLAARKKSAKNLKSKDSAKKIEALKYCLEDELFVQEPDVLPLVISFLSKVKVSELVHETLRVFDGLLTKALSDSASTHVGGSAAAADALVESAPKSGIHARAIARFVVEQSVAPESPWKGCEPFLAVLAAGSLASEIKILAIEVYRKLLRVAVDLVAGDPRQTKALASLQTCGNPRAALLAMLDVDHAGVQFAALTCFAALVQHLVDFAFLENAEQQSATAKVFAFATHSERRFHEPTLSIVDSLSRLERGRAFLRAHSVSELLKSMLAAIADASTSAPSPVTLTADEAAIVASITSVIATSVSRLECAREQLEANGVARNVNEATVFPVIDALVQVLQTDVASAVAPPPPASVPPTSTAAAAANAPPPSSTPVLPFPVDKCIAIVTALGRLAQSSAGCKARMKARGVLPALLDCFKVSPSESLHQVVDKLLHVCAELASGGNDKAVTVDARLLSVSAGDSVDASAAPEPSVIEAAAFVAPDSVVSLLETASAMDDKRTLFRLVRWLATAVEAPANARALGDCGISTIVRITIETSPSDGVLMGFLSRCVGAIVEQSSSACESCGSEGRDPTAALVTFLQSAKVASDTSEGTAAAFAGSAHERCKLEWLDEEKMEAIFEPSSLTHVCHDVNPFVFATDALCALVRGFAKWNAPGSDVSNAPSSSDFSELLLQRLDASSAAGASGAAKVNVAAPSKKKIDISKPAAVGESVACAVLEKSLELLELVAFFSLHLPAVASGILRLVTHVLQLPSGVKALLYLARATYSTASSTAPSPDVAAVPVAARFVDWPLSKDESERTEFASLVRPLLRVLCAPDATFLELDAAVAALDVLTAPDPSSPVVYSVGIAAGVEAATVDVPIAQCDVFLSVAANAGALVLLMTYTDVCRLPDSPTDAVHRDALAERVKTLVNRFVRAGSQIHTTAVAKFEAQLAASAADPASAPASSESAAPQAPRPLSTPFAARWAKAVLDVRADAPRFEYYGYSAILLAAELCDSDIASSLLAAGASPDTASVDGTTALMLALITGNEALVAQLLAQRANVDAMTIDGSDLCAWTCALAAPLGQDVRETITRSHTSNCGVQNMQLLVELDTIAGSPALLDKLLATRVDVNVSNADGNFLLHALVSKLLVRKQVRGLDVCVRYHSQRIGNKTFVLDTATTLLTKHGANVNACNLLGQTALHLALLFGHADAVECLLRHGANPNIQDVYGYLPLHYACLGLCTSGETSDASSASAVATVRALLDAGAKFPILTGAHTDERKHKLPHEKTAIAIEHILDAGFVDTTVPPAITTQVATPAQLLATRGIHDGLLPHHFACGGCNQVVSTLCLDDEMRTRFSRNGSARAAILAFLQTTGGVDLSQTANKGMTSLHFALKTDVAGFNTAVLDLLLANNACRAQLNAVHEATVIDSLPPIPEGSQVDVLTANLHAIHCYVSARSFDSKYHIILPNGTHLEHLVREQIQQSDAESATPTTAAIAAGGHVPKYLHLGESAFSSLHYAVQTSDALSRRLLALPGIALTPDGSDLPLLALACIARRSADIVAQLVGPQANMRVHLPLLGAQRDVIANQIATCSLASRKHAAALHYAILYEDVAVVTALVTQHAYTNVNVRRSGDGFTPLHLACEMSNMALIRVLLDHGASLLQLSTLSSAAQGVTPLHLLLKHDTSENERLKTLVAERYLQPVMLLEHLGGPLVHRAATPRDPDQALNPESQASSSRALLASSSSSNLLEPVAALNDQDAVTGITCMLLAAEEYNLELYARVSQLRESHREGQTLSKRLIKDLEKSDDVLRVFFQMFADAPNAAVVSPAAPSSSRDAVDSSSAASAPPSVTFETLAHRHECYRQKIVRSQWIAPRPPPVMRRASNNASGAAQPSSPRVAVAASAAPTDASSERALESASALDASVATSEGANAKQTSEVLPTT